MVGGMSVSNSVHMPPFDGATAWIGSEPLSPAALRGHVVLVNFWTLTCINWLRQEPYVRAWAQAYRADGLVVLGVHTPEFSFEHDVERVRRAVADAGDRLPGRRRQRLRGLARLRQPLLAGAVLRRRRRRHPRPALRRRALRSSPSACSSSSSGSSASSSPPRGGAWRRRPTGITCARPRRTSASGGARDHRARPSGLPLNRWALAGAWVGRTASASSWASPAGASPSVSTRATCISCSPAAPAGRSPSACASTARRRASPTASTSTSRGRRARRRPAVPARPSARRGARAHARDHVPRGRRRGVRVHLRMTTLTPRRPARARSARRSPRW